MHQVTKTISIDDSELEESFVRSSGPGGQNVNKVSSAVQLRFDVRRSPSLPNEVAIRLMKLAGSRLTKEGVIVIVAQEYRDQSRNRAEARERLTGLIPKAEAVTRDHLRAVRACEALEGIGTPEAKALLAGWAKGPAGATVVREATESLERLTGRTR